MRVVADGDLGIVLVFKDEEELTKVIGNLKRMLDWKEKEHSPYPAAYWSGPDGVSENASDAFIVDAKKAVPGGGE